MMIRIVLEPKELKIESKSSLQLTFEYGYIGFIVGVPGREYPNAPPGADGYPGGGG